MVNEEALADQTDRLAGAIAVAEVEKRTGVLVTATRFSRGEVRRAGSFVAFIFGGGGVTPVEVVSRAFPSTESELF